MIPGRQMAPGDHTCDYLSLNKWGKGFFSYDKYSDVTYHQNGVQIYAPEDGLTIYQRRDFLAPRYYDQGCDVIPLNSRSSVAEQKMLQENFRSTDPFQSNDNPLTCVGIKGLGINSYGGWEIPQGQKKPIWMLNDENYKYSGKQCNQ